MYAHRRSIIQMIPVQIAPDLGSQWAIERADGCALQGKSSPQPFFFVTSQPFACLNVQAIRSHLEKHIPLMDKHLSIVYEKFCIK